MVTMLLMFALLVGFGSQVHAVPDAAPGKSDVQLTEAQKQEIAALEKDILNKKKEVVSRYIKYGVISEEKGKKIISRMEKRYQLLEQNGFIPKWNRSMHKQCR